MAGPPAQSRLRDSLVKIGKQSLAVIVGIIFALAGVSLISDVLGAATRLHWIVGLLAAVLLLAVLLWLLWWIRQAPLTSMEFGRYPRIGLGLNLLLVTVTAMVAMATLSDILFQQNWARYTSERPITVGLLLDYYGWHLVDSIPVIDVWSVTGIASPAEGVGFLANLLLQVFLVLIIAAAIDIFRSKRGDVRYLLRIARAIRDGKAGLPKEQALEQAQRHIDQAWSVARQEGTRVHKIDVLLEYAHLLLELGKKDKVLENLKEAHRLIELEAEERDLAARQRSAQDLQNRLTSS